MFSQPRIAVQGWSMPGAKRRRQRPLLDWFFGCLFLAAVSTFIGLERFGELGDECFLCPEDIGWPLVVSAYAIPGLAIGSALWAIVWMTRLRRGLKLGQLKPILVILFVAIAMLVTSLQYRDSNEENYQNGFELP